MTRLTGGCQCGAVRFTVTGDLGRASICHCRMCQKAFGAFYGPLVAAPLMAWTRGAPAYFQSSNRARRGFCRDCGTPLTFEPDDGPVELAIGAFDDPARVPPVIQHSIETRLHWLSKLDRLPVRSPAEARQVAPYYASIRSFQHPDRDT
ncbi:MAG: GFA family protein [Caulobacteraceae bacterium]